MSNVDKKQVLRETIYEEMEKRGIARFPLPCRGRVPNFEGAEEAAEKFRELEFYKRASIILVSPDSPQAPVRRNILLDGKRLVMASPRLRRGFVLVDPLDVIGRESEASTIRGAFKHGRILDTMPPVDLVVEGCVAVDPKGNRLGKGGGYGDREIKTSRILNDKVIVATTCHSMQVVESVPIKEGDERVNYIVTERGIIKTLRNGVHLFDCK